MKLGCKRKGIDGGRESGDLPLTRGLTVMAGCGIRHGGCSPLRTTTGGEGRRVQALWRRCEQGRRESGAARCSLASRAAVLHRVARQPPAPPSSSPRHPLACIIMAAQSSSPPARPVAASRRPRPGCRRRHAPSPPGPPPAPRAGPPPPLTPFPRRPLAGASPACPVASSDRPHTGPPPRAGTPPRARPAPSSSHRCCRLLISAAGLGEKRMGAGRDWARVSARSAGFVFQDWLREAMMGPTVRHKWESKWTPATCASGKGSVL
jgi:hypothetical protein